MTFSIIYWIYSILDGIYSSLDRIHSRPIPLIFSLDRNHSRLDWIMSRLNHQMMVNVNISGSETDKDIILSDSTSKLRTWILGYGLIAEYQNFMLQPWTKYYPHWNDFSPDWIENNPGWIVFIPLQENIYWLSRCLLLVLTLYCPGWVYLNI